MSNKIFKKKLFLVSFSIGRKKSFRHLLCVIDFRQTVTVKRQLFQTYCRSTLYYGIETIVMNKSEMTKLEKAETIAIKDAIGITRRSRNTALWEAMNLTRTEDQVSNRKLNLVERLTKNAFTLKIIHATIAKLSWATTDANKWEKRSIVNELLTKTSEVPYVPNRTEDTTKQFFGKCRVLQSKQHKKAEEPLNQDLRVLVDRVHAGDATMRATILKKIDTLLHYEDEN